MAAVEFPALLQKPSLRPTRRVAAPGRAPRLPRPAQARALGAGWALLSFELLPRQRQPPWKGVRAYLHEWARRRAAKERLFTPPPPPARHGDRILSFRPRQPRRQARFYPSRTPTASHGSGLRSQPRSRLPVKKADGVTGAGRQPTRLSLFQAPRELGPSRPAAVPWAAGHVLVRTAVRGVGALLPRPSPEHARSACAPDGAWGVASVRARSRAASAVGDPGARERGGGLRQDDRGVFTLGGPPALHPDFSTRTVQTPQPRVPHLPLTRPRAQEPGRRRPRHVLPSSPSPPRPLWALGAVRGAASAGWVRPQLVQFGAPFLSKSAKLDTKVNADYNETSITGVAC